MSTFRAKGMWESTRRLEREAYEAGSKVRCAELAALRKLEQAVRACGLPNLMCSGESFQLPLAEALTDIDKARGDK